jgi:fucose permease
MLASLATLARQSGEPRTWRSRLVGATVGLITGLVLLAVADGLSAATGVTQWVTIVVLAFILGTAWGTILLRESYR